jgi:hypothetical protein
MGRLVKYLLLALDTLLKLDGLSPTIPFVLNRIIANSNMQDYRKAEIGV